MPTTISALLAARLESLPDDERAVLVLASVDGMEFHRSGASRELAPEARSARARSRLLGASVRKRPDPARPVELRGDEAFRFRHLLIRDAAYRSLSKAQARRPARAVRRLARAQGRASASVEYEEIVGYHLEQAYRYAGRARRVGRAGGGIRARAGTGCPRPGIGQLQRDEWRAAISILKRADALLGPRHPRAAVLALRMAQGHAGLDAIGGEQHLNFLAEAERRAMLFRKSTTQ